MKKIFYIILPLFLLIFGSCSMSDSSLESPLDETGISVDAYFYIPLWDASKSSDSRYVDPDSAIVEIYVDGDSLGEFALTIGDDNIGSATISGLEARTYPAGSITMDIYDSSYNILTLGENLSEVTLSAQGSNSIEFSSVPYLPTSVFASDPSASSSLSDGEAIFYELDVTGGNTYKFSATRTSSTGDMDLYIYDEAGRLVNDSYGTESQDEVIELYMAPEYTGKYYAAVKSYSGEGPFNFDYDLSDVTVTDVYTITGVLTFPAATAGNEVYINLGTDVEFSKTVGRSGDTTMYFVIPNVPSGTSSTFNAFVDRDSDGFKTVDDYGGYVSISTITDHRRDFNLELELHIGIRGSITIPVPASVGTRTAMMVINEYGWGAAIYTPYNLSTSSSFTNYEVAGEVGTQRVLYIYDLDNSGLSLSSLFYPSDLNTFLTHGDYFWLSDPITLSTSSVSGFNGTMETFDMTGYSSFTDWLADQ